MTTSTTTEIQQPRQALHRGSEQLRAHATVKVKDLMTANLTDIWHGDRTVSSQSFFDNTTGQTPTASILKLKLKGSAALFFNRKSEKRRKVQMGDIYRAILSKTA